MPVIIAMLRGVNLGSHNRIKMDALRELHESLRCADVQTYLQSGNVVFRTPERNPASLAKRIENEIERKFRFRVDVIVRTCIEMRKAVERNPFAKRKGIDPSRLLVTFLAEEPKPEARDKALGMQAEPEELHILGREMYIYYANGLARPKLSWVAVQKVLKVTGTGRNWNTVQGLLELAEKIEGS